MNRLKKLTLIDIKDLLILLILYPLSKLFKTKFPNVWLISERDKEARDNGFWFFKFIHENSKNDFAYYVIKKESSDVNKLLKINKKKVIYLGSLKHFFFYLLAECQIRAHTEGGMPNKKICTFIEQKNLIRNKKVFLQHGITKDIFIGYFYKNTKFDLFICGAQPEYTFVKDNFGYPSNNVVLTGLCRYDNLNTYNTKKQILVMPTWRSYLYNTEEILNTKFLESQYYKEYMALLNDKKIRNLIEQYNFKIVFYPHSGMQTFLKYFEVKDKNIIIANQKDYDVQTLLKESEILITDYSSVFFDMAYMKKPCIYYHFDYVEYRSGHLKEGYFQYEIDSFGPIVQTIEELFNKLDNYFKNNFNLEKEYLDKVDNFFPFQDKSNCLRVFNSIEKI